MNKKIIIISSGLVLVIALFTWLGSSSEKKEEQTIVKKEEVLIPQQSGVAQALYDEALKFEKEKDKIQAKIIYKKIYDEHPDFEGIAKVQQRLESLNMDVIVSNSPLENKTVMHEVVSGDTLGEIAKKYGTTISLIKKVMLDRDLAELYGVETKYLTRQVRRNIDRFPSDFLLILKQQEVTILKCQFGTSSWGGSRKLPMAFTEHGILMLASVLRSKKAAKVNIEIMRTFTHLREMIERNKELKHQIEEMEKNYNYQFKAVFDVIKKILQQEGKSNKKISFHSEALNKERKYARKNS